MKKELTFNYFGYLFKSKSIVKGMPFILAGFSGGSLGANHGTEKAPKALIEEFGNVWSSESGNVTNPTVFELNLDNSNLDTSHAVIEEFVASKERPFVLGGDHSITFASFKGFLKKHPNSGLLVFDAHADCMDDFPTHEDHINSFVSQCIVKPENILLVGLRNVHPKERAFLKQHNIRFFDMKQCYFLGVKDLTSIIMEICNKLPFLYTSIDIDVIDPSAAPGTGHLEPGGFTAREFIHMMQRIAMMKNFSGGDLMEINPDKDLNKMTVRLGAKILKEIAHRF